MYYSRLLCLPILTILAIHAHAQLSTITSFTPESIDTLAPMRGNTPDVLACANGHCYAFGRYDGASYRPDQPGAVWSPLVMPNTNEVVYAVADAGAAVLLMTRTVITGSNGYEFFYRLYRTEHGPDGMELSLEIALSGQDGLDSDRYGQFNVVNNSLVYFSLGKSISPGAYNFWNYYSTDNGRNWTALGLQKNPMTTARQAGNLYVMLDEERSIFSEGPDSLYWSLSPTFSAHNVTPAPQTSVVLLDMIWHQDSLFVFNTYDSLFYFSAYGGLVWEARPLPGKRPVVSVVLQQDTWYFANADGMFKASSPMAPWTPVYQFQDCFNPTVERLFLPDETGLPWLAGAATALLRPADPQGDNWTDFSQGLPGQGTQSFEAVQDTLYSAYAYTTFQSTDGLSWQGLRSPGLRGARWVQSTGMIYHKGHYFVTAEFGDWPSTTEGIFVRPDGADWSLLDTTDSQGYTMTIAAGNENLYWFNSLSLRRSTDLGQNWQFVDLPPGATYFRIVPKGDTLFLLTSNPNQLWRSIDQGLHWVELTLPAVSGYFSLIPFGERLVFAGEKLVTWVSDNDGLNWVQTNQGMSANYAVGYQVVGNMLVAHLSTSQLGFYRGVMLSLDAGAHWLKLRLPTAIESNTYYGFEQFKEYFYYGHWTTGNFRFPDRLVIQKLEEITPKVPIRELNPDSGITVSPNPAASETWLRATPELSLPLLWRLHDMQGRKVLEGEMDQVEYRIGLAGLANGLYWLHFPVGQTRAVPVLVQH